ncbi:MAG TPA: hypothetical protein VHK26_03575, partial [Methyloceanibacter sp.]|nr:hypothetical protein [Methyloceanibacter sp.]
MPGHDVDGILEGLEIPDGAPTRDRDGLAAYEEMLKLDREVVAANIADTKRQRIVSIDLNKI